MRARKVFWFFIWLTALVAAVVIWWWIRPAKAVQDGLTNMIAADRQAFKIKVAVSNPQASLDILGEKASMQLNVNGKYQRRKDGHYDTEAVVGLTTATESMTMLVEANTRFIGRDVYVNVTKAPPSLPAVAALKGVWIKLSQDTVNGVDELPAREGIFTNVSALGKMYLSGESTRVYRAELTLDAVVRVLDSLAFVLGHHLSAEQMDSVKQSMTGVETKVVPVEIAMTPWTRQIRQIKSEVVASNNNNTEIVFNFTTEDEPIGITVPEGAKTWEEITK